MPDAGYPLEAYLIIDNNAVVNLCEFFCDANKKQPFNDMIHCVCDEIGGVFKALRRFALNGKIYTTPQVQQEFLPERGGFRELPGFSPERCRCLKDRVQAEVEALTVNPVAIQRLRSLPQTPKKLGESLSRLSDPDLSLAVLALGIAGKLNQRVYVLTDEEDLRVLISWMKSRAEVQAQYQHAEKIEGLHSMAYIDSAHRRCSFTTTQVTLMMSFLMMQQMKRSMLFGTTKGEMINTTFRTLYDAVRESGKIKEAHLAGSL